MNQSTGRGGRRAGAGRKKGASVYGESTRPLRIPESLLAPVQTLLQLKQEHHQKRHELTSPSLCQPAQDPSRINLPLFFSKVAAGFPSPADDFIEKTLDLNELLVKRPAATFFVRAEGESMLGAGIHPDDILVVDRSLEPLPGKIVICALNGELTVKRLKEIAPERLLLGAENPAYPDIEVSEAMDMVIWGVVTGVIHQFK